MHGGKCIGDFICKEVPVPKVLEELPDRIDHALKMRMAQSSYKKVCAKHPGRTLPHDPFAKKSDSTAADHAEVRAALADSIARLHSEFGFYVLRKRITPRVFGAVLITAVGALAGKSATYFFNQK